MYLGGHNDLAPLCERPAHSQRHGTGINSVLFQNLDSGVHSRGDSNVGVHAVMHEPPNEVMINFVQISQYKPM